MTQVDDALLERMVHAIVDEVDPHQVILFGSGAAVAYARGLPRLQGHTGLQPRRGRVLARLPQPCARVGPAEGKVLYERP